MAEETLKRGPTSRTTVPRRNRAGERESRYSPISLFSSQTLTAAAINLLVRSPNPRPLDISGGVSGAGLFFEVSERRPGRPFRGTSGDGTVRGLSGSVSLNGRDSMVGEIRSRAVYGVLKRGWAWEDAGMRPARVAVCLATSRMC